MTEYSNCKKKAIRILSLSPYNAHTEPLFKELKLLKVMDILKLQQLKFYYKFRNQKLPYYLQALPLNYNRDMHSYSTRTQNNLHVIGTKHEFAKNCIRHDVIKTVNSTPDCILDKIDTHSLNGYARYIKHYILSSYHERCLIRNCYICSRS